MLTALARRTDQHEEGFTLIELMVVVLIIAILLAIAIPTFLGARTRAQDRAAQSTLRLALTAEKIYFVDKNNYTATPSDLTSIEPTLTYLAQLTAPTLPAVNKVAVAVDAATGTIVCLTATSASGAVFAMADESVGLNPGTYYFPGPGSVMTAPLAACDDTVSGGAKHF